VIIHDDISLMRFVIPGLTRNPVFFWIPAFTGMTAFAAIHVAVYSSFRIYKASKLFLPSFLLRILSNTLGFINYAMLHALCLPAAGRRFTVLIFPLPLYD